MLDVDIPDEDIPEVDNLEELSTLMLDIMKLDEISDDDGIIANELLANSMRLAAKTEVDTSAGDKS